MALLPKKSTSPPLYVAEKFATEENPIFLMSLVRTRFIGTLDAALAAKEITAAQWGILRMISDGRGDTAAELCRLHGYDTGSMTRMLDRLEEKELIRRERSRHDRRQVHVRLTAAGTAMAARGLTTMVKVLNGYMDGFTPAELEAFKSFMRRMLDNADA